MTKVTKLLFAFIAVLLISSLSCFAQKSKSNKGSITLSEVFKERMLLPSIHASDSTLVFFRHNFRKGWIRSYEIATKKLGPKFKTSTVLKEAGNRGRGHTATMLYKGNLFYITQDFSKENELLTLFYSVISKEGQVITPAKEFMTISSKKERRVNIDIEQSRNEFTLKAKVVIDKDDEEELIIANFDYNFKQLSYFKFNDKEILQDKEGTMYPPLYGFSDSLYMVNIFEEDRKSKKLKPITSVYVFTKTGRKLFSQELNTDNIGLFSFKLLRVGNESRLIAYYSDDKSDGIDGSVTYIYDPKLNKFVVKESNKIPASVKAAFLSKSSIKKGKGIERFAYSSMDFTDNGELYNINEQAIEVTTTRTDSRTGRMSTTVEYYTGHQLLLEKYDSTGKLALTTNVETPMIKKVYFNNQVFKILTQGNKAAIYMSTYSQLIPKNFRTKIKDYNRKDGFSIYLYTLKGSNEKKWKKVNFPLEKGYFVDDLKYIPETNKAFVILSKRRPAFFGFWKNLFHIKFKTRVGIVNVNID